MRNLTPSLVIGFLSCVGMAHADSRSLEGYGKTTWGMSPEQVVAAESPRAKSMAKPTPFDRGTAAALVSIPSMKIDNVSFNALFVFDTKRKLKKVVLTSEQQKYHSVNVVDFASLERLLVEKYGAPTYKADLPPEAEGNHVVSWKLPKTIIKLNLMFIPQIVTMVTISYEPTISSEEESRDL